MDENYYVSHGGKIPVKWTAPEVMEYSYDIVLNYVTLWILQAGTPIQKVLHCQ